MSLLLPPSPAARAINTLSGNFAGLGGESGAKAPLSPPNPAYFHDKSWRTHNKSGGFWRFFLW